VDIPYKEEAQKIALYYATTINNSKRHVAVHPDAPRIDLIRERYVFRLRDPPGALTALAP
jgi:hypothetical protein